MWTLHDGILWQPRNSCLLAEKKDQRFAACRAEEKASQAPREQDVKSSHSRLVPCNYVSTDGKRKATLGDAYVENKADASREQLASSSGRLQPWSMGWQISERNLMWNNDLAERLIQRVTAEELDCSDEEVQQRFRDLFAVLPGLAQRMHTTKPKILAQLSEDPAGIAEKLLQLKAVFPGANIEQMVLRDLRLVLEQSVEDISTAAQQLRSLLPEDVDVDRLCQEHPSMLDVPSFKDALDEVKRLMPRLNISTALNNEPEIIFSTQRAKSMIPYDPVPGSSY